MFTVTRYFQAKPNFQQFFMRIDKYLWCVRLFKTRNLAAEACKTGKVLINQFSVKPSREIKAGDVFEIKRPPIVRRYEVLEVLNRRVGAKLVSDYLKDSTPVAELQKLENSKLEFYPKRERGAGRPTKKERRDLTDFF